MDDSLKEAAIYADRLVQKEQDYNELQSTFTKYKLKQKVKYDKLRDEVVNFLQSAGTNYNENDVAPLLLIRLNETESRLEDAEKKAESLSNELQRRQTQINDQIILIRNLEEQLRSSPTSKIETSKRKRLNEIMDIEGIHAQITYKDERIVELNNVILDKERQILDLQEMCREQGEVASSKKQAMKLVQKKFEELESITRRSIGTETDASLAASASSSRALFRGREQRSDQIAPTRGPIRSASPGRAVKGNSGCSSPPPLDPSEQDDDDFNSKKNLDEEKRKKKRVTFDLPPSGSVESVLLPETDRNESSPVVGSSVVLLEPTPDREDGVTSLIEQLNSENESLRRDLEQTRLSLAELQGTAAQSDVDLARTIREGKSAALKARVAAQARIKDLEDRMGNLNSNYATQTERLQTEIETLRSTREWEIEENARLREKIAAVKEKNHKLSLEVEAGVHANREMEERMLQEHDVLQRMMEDLENAEGIVVYQEEQKQMILDDVEKLKEAILAQEKFIEVLEADIVIYEEHIGLLRENLGASKIDHRDLIRSKAFDLKIKALEAEKQEIDKTRNDERLRTKALNAKVRILEAENEKLMARVCEMEMRGGDEDEERDEKLDTLRLELQEADIRMSSIREEYENQLIVARQDAERTHHQTEILRDQVDRLQNDLESVNSRSTQSCSQEETVLSSEQEALTFTELRTELADLQTQLDIVETERDDLNEKITQMGAENFELNQRLIQEQHVNEELQSLRQVVRDYERMDAQNINIIQERDYYQQQTAQFEEDLESLKLQLYDKDEKLRNADEEQLQMKKEIDILSHRITEISSAQTESSVTIVENNHLKTYDSTDTECIENLRQENNSLRSELDHARLSLAETREVQREVELLKHELEEERRQGEAKWAEVCQRLVRSESAECGESANAGRISRKTSLEEMHCYLDAYADKCRRLEEELRDSQMRLNEASVTKPNSSDKSETAFAFDNSLSEQLEKVHALECEMEEKVEENEKYLQRVRHLESELQRSIEKIEADKLEKKKLKLAVKQLRDKVAQEKENGFVKNELLNKVDVVPVQSSNNDEFNKENEELKIKLETTEMEARLSGELNVELGRAIEELEERIYQLENDREKDHEELNIMEAENHRLLEEMNKMVANSLLQQEQLRSEESLQSQKIVFDLTKNVEELKLHLEKMKSEAIQKDQHIEELIDTQNRIAQEEQESQTAHDNEMRSLSINNEDLRRAASDLEARIEHKEHQIGILSQQLVDTQLQKTSQTQSGDAEYKVEANVAVQQHESLVRASAATSQAVAIVKNNETQNDDQRSHLQQQSVQQTSTYSYAANMEPSQYSQSHTSFTSQPSQSGSEAHSHEYDQQYSSETPIFACSTSNVNVAQSQQPSSSDHGLMTHPVYAPSQHVTQVDSVEPTQSSYPSSQASQTHQLNSHSILADCQSNTTALEPARSDENVTQTSVVLVQSGSDLFTENQLLRECVNETARMHDDLGVDVDRLMTLKEELENAVEALRGEIWSLSGQLKASVLDRENLSDRVATLDSKLDAEKRRADQLDQELSEQAELTEKAQRQAAESENESNRRLAECLDMEQRREELEKAYTQLTDYYTQLQSAYSVLYQRVQSERVDASVATESSANAADACEETTHLPTVYREHLKAIRDHMHRLRDELVHLTKDVLDTELASIESQLTSSIEKIAAMISTVGNAEVTNSSEEESALNIYLSEIISECNIEIDESVTDIRSKVARIHEILLVKIREVEDSRTAISEQRRACSALEKRLAELEQFEDAENAHAAQRRLAEVNTILENRTYECDQLQLRVEELQTAIADLSIANEEREAARLATRQADVDALFRANADLAHTNVALQNELSDKEHSLENLNHGESGNRWNEAEIARLREVERLLNERVAYLSSEMNEAVEKISLLQEKLDIAEQKASSAADLEWGWNEEAEKELDSDTTARVKSLEEELTTLRAQLEEVQHLRCEEDNKEEITRLRSVEDLLRKTISGFEDKLLEAEMRIGELEDTLFEERQQKVEETEQKNLAETETSLQANLLLKTQLEESVKKVDSANSEIALLRSICDSRNDTISQLRIELEECGIRIKNLEECQTKPEMNTDTDGWGNWSEQLNSQENDGRAEEIEKLKQTEAQLRTQLKSQLDEIERMETGYVEELEDMKTTEEELRKRVKELEKQFFEKEQHLTSESTDEWGVDWGVTSDSQIEEIEELRTNLEQSQSLVATLTATLSDRSIEIDQMQVEIGEMRSRILGEETEKTELVCQENKTVECQQSSQSAAVDDEDSWGESWGEESPQNGAIVDLMKERELRQEAETQRDQLVQRVKDLTEEISELRKNISASDSSETDLRQLRGELASLKDQLQETRAHAGEMQIKLEEVENPKAEKESEWGWGDDEQPIEDNEFVLLRERFSVLEDDLRKALLRIDEMEKDRLNGVEDNEQLLKDFDEMQTNLQDEVTALLNRVEELEREKNELEQVQKDKLAEADTLKLESQQELTSIRVELDECLRKLDDAEQESHANGDLERQLVQLNEKLAHAIKQNDLLKDSEGRLLESVDEYGEQMEKYKEEAERLQLVVNDLERQLLEINELRERLRESEVERDQLKRAQDDADNDGWGDASSEQLVQLQTEIERLQILIQTKEACLEQICLEKESLSQRLKQMEKQLNAAEQERDSVKRLYDELRTKIAARRRANAAVTRDVSRRSSVASTVDHDIPEEPRGTSPQIVQGFGSSFDSTTSNQGVATQDTFRRRGAPKKTNE